MTTAVQWVEATGIAIKVEEDSKGSRATETEDKGATDSNRRTEANRVATRQDLHLRLSTVDRFKDLIMEGIEVKWEEVQDRTSLVRSLWGISVKSTEIRQPKFYRLSD